MSTITSTPAASRIAQIRSTLGQRGSGTGSGAFAHQLDSFRSSAPTFSVDETVRAASPVTATPEIGSSAAATSSTVNETVPFASLFNEAGERHGVDPALLAAVAEIESAFSPTAISSAGAEGLMQFMPATAGEMGVDSCDPASAVDGAARYLRRELDRFGSIELALAAYNAGPGAVQRHGGVPPFAETQRYVDKVLSAYESHNASESHQ